MRILYCAIDQTVPGTLGGSVHTERVAMGLASLGHVVTALVTPGDGPFPAGSVEWQAVPAPSGRPHFRALRAPQVARIADAFRPDIVVERYHNFGGEGVRAAVRLGVPVALEVNAPIVDHPGSAKRLIDRALLVQPMRRWRDWQCAHTDLFITPSRATLPAWVDSDRVLEIEWGADTDRFSPGASLPRRSSGPPAPWQYLRVRFARGTVPFTSCAPSRCCVGRESTTQRRPDWPGTGMDSRARGSRRHDGPCVHGHAAARRHARRARCMRHRVAPFDASRHRSLSLGFYWSPLKVFEYMASGLPVVAPHIPRLARLIEDGREGRLYDGDDPNALAATLLALHRDPVARAALGASARLRAVADYSWRAHCERLSSAFSPSCGSRRNVRIADRDRLVSPNCGGSGWSTWELARGLRQRGHTIDVVQPRPGTSGIHSREYRRLRDRGIRRRRAVDSFRRNYFKNERLYTALKAHLSARLTRDRPDIVHAQHVLTAPPAIGAARAADLPVVVTVRDYWPVCYWSTLIVDPATERLCPACSAAGMCRCLQGRVGLAWPVAASMIPYMQANLARKRSALASADAVIAVSNQIGGDLVARAPELAGTRVEVVPNPFDLASLTETARAVPPPRTAPYALYVGKLEPNKGADLLPRTAQEAGLTMPLMVVGDRSQRASIEREARDLGVDLHVTGWLSAMPRSGG